MNTIIAILVTIYVCVGIMIYIIASLIGGFCNGFGCAFGWPTRKSPLWHRVLDLMITILFWPILLIFSR